MRGSKRRKGIAVLLFAQAALFGWGFLVTALFVVFFLLLPSVPLGAVAIPVLILSLTVIRDARRVQTHNEPTRAPL